MTRELAAARETNGRAPSDDDIRSSVFSPVQLPCGKTVQNRLAKVALYEHLAVFPGGPPNEYHYALYSEWGKSNWGMVFTGNVQVASDHLTFGRDIILPDQLTDQSLAPYRRLAALMQGRGEAGAEKIAQHPPSLAIMQLSHGGRQSGNIIGGRSFGKPPLAPSPVRVGDGIPDAGFCSNAFNRLLFPIPLEMTVDDIEHAISRFVYGARVAHESGFDGVEIHAAHGYLLAQFINPKSNHRKDEFSVENGNDLRVLRTIVSRIRETLPADFVVGIKLNAGDYSEGPKHEGSVTATEQRALGHILSIAQWGGVDFIELSGGDYENPDFISGAPKSRRQAFFSHISQKALQALEKMPRTISSPPLPLIMLTGGFSTPALLHTALSARHAQLIGIGRSAVLCPDLPIYLQTLDPDSAKWPNTLFAPEPDLSRPKFVEAPVINRVWRAFSGIRLVGAGVNVAWYEVSMRYLAERSMDPKVKAPYPDYRVSGFLGVFRMLVWRAWRVKSSSPSPSTLTATYFPGLFAMLLVACVSFLFVIM